MHWEDSTIGTPLYGYTIPDWRGLNSIEWVQLIKEWYKSLSPGGVIPQ